MTSPIIKCNNLMKLLKPYLENGYTHNITEKLLKVVNQLEQQELAFIMAKYVTLAERVDSKHLIKVGKAEDVRKHLNITPKEFNQLAYHTSQKVMRLYYEKPDSDY